MNCLLIAAGFCTRLFPITEYFPKALLTVGGKTILSMTLDEVVALRQIESIAVVTNHRYADMFRTWLAATYPTRKITVLDNGVTSPETRKGAIGDLVYALDTLKWDDDLLVLASDTLTSLRIRDFLKFYTSHAGVVTPVFDTKEPEIIRNKLGSVKLDGDRIIRFTEKPDYPETTLTSIPFYLFPKKYLPLIRKYMQLSLPTDAPGSLIAWLVNECPCYAYVIPRQGYYYDVGTIDVYNRLAASGVGVKQTPKK